MATLQLKTDLNCSTCVSHVSPSLDQLLGPGNWQVDTASADKVLFIDRPDAQLDAITSALQSAGYHVFGNAETAVRPGLAPLPTIGKAIKVKGEEMSGTCCAPTTLKSDAAFFSSDFWANKIAWRRAGFNTLNCLIGCSIGDFSMMFLLMAYYPSMDVWLMMGLAMAAGLSTSIMLEASILRIREKFAWALAFRTAVGMSFASMLAMELTENLTDFYLTDQGRMPMSEPFFWVALVIAMAAGFLVPLPYNYYKLRRHGKACH